MTGGSGINNKRAITLRRPDGSFMSREEVIVERRGALKWLPVLCSNDMVHGSWWFVWGSVGFVVSAVIPLINIYIGAYKQEDDVMPTSDYDLTWGLLVISGIFYTIGSWGFVRAFEEPPKRALFYDFKHLQTDELLGAWCFFLGTVPAVPYCMVFYSLHHETIFLAGAFAAFLFVCACGLVVVAAYPSDTPIKVDKLKQKIAQLEAGRYERDSKYAKSCGEQIKALKKEVDKLEKQANYVLPACMAFGRLTGRGVDVWMVRHLANDWLAACWFFFWGNLLLTIGSLLLLISAIAYNAPSEQLFIWISGTIDAFLFFVGSMYYVAGSYPLSQQFYYAVERRESVAGKEEAGAAAATAEGGYVAVEGEAPAVTNGDDDDLETGMSMERGDEEGPIGEAATNPLQSNVNVTQASSSGAAGPSLKTGVVASSSQALDLRLNTKINNNASAKVISSAGVKLDNTHVKKGAQAAQRKPTGLATPGRHGTNQHSPRSHHESPFAAKRTSLASVSKGFDDADDVDVGPIEDDGDE